jgi:hypothetical protein
MMYGTRPRTRGQLLLGQYFLQYENNKMAAVRKCSLHALLVLITNQVSYLERLLNAGLQLEHRPTYTLCMKYCLHSTAINVATLRIWKLYFKDFYFLICFRWSLWPHGLRRGSATARLLGLRVRIPTRAWMSVSCECCVVRWRSLRRADHLFRAVLPSVVCLSVIVKCRQWRGLGSLGAVEALEKIKKNVNSSNKSLAHRK